jgi:hypothetical protein
MNRQMIATFKVESGKIVASDTCYKLGAWCANFLPARNGTYKVFLTRGYEKDFESWGERNWKMEVIHEDVKTEDLPWEMVDGSFCVDSGTFGFFDFDYYAESHTDKVDDDWYEDNVCSEDGYWNVVDGKGVWCQSGYGDGSYDVDAVYDGDEVVALQVTFIYEVEEDVEDVANWEVTDEEIYG